MNTPLRNPGGWGPPPPQKPAPAFNVPRVVLVMAGAMIAAHVLFRVMPVDWSNEILVYLVFNPSHLEFFDRFPIEIGARWVGHTMVHAEWMHLLVNAAFLVAFGTPIARQIPAYSFLLLFFLGAAGGMGVLVLFYGGQDIVAIGASGAVSAMVGALARMIYLRRGSEVVPSPFNDRRNGTIFVAIFFAVNVLVLFLPGPNGSSVAGEAHIGGFLSGFLLSLILPWRRTPAPPSEGVSTYGP